MIRSATICRLGFVNENYAYIVPLNFGYQGGILYFHTGPKGRKIDLIRANPKVTFEIDTEHTIKKGDNACDWNMVYQSIMGRGVASFITNREQKRQALDIIMKQYSDKVWVFPDEKVAITTLFQVQIQSVSARSNHKKDII